MIVMLRPLTVTSISNAAVENMLFMLLPGHFQAFGAPKPVNPFEVDYPVSFSQLDSYPAIPVSWMLEVQFQQILDNWLIFIRQLGLIPLGTSGLV